jgi:hypothetical protein
MKDRPLPKRAQALAKALDHMRAAIELLDEARAPAQIAALVDLGLCQLVEAIAAEGGRHGPQSSAPNF